MKKTIVIAALAAAICSSINAGAQTNTAFFLDNYVYGYRLNPAIMSEKGFVGLGVSNIDLGLQSDLGVSAFLYPNEAKNGLVTGLHSSVSAEEFLSKIQDANRIGLDAGINIFSAGRRKETKMSNFEINLKANGGAYLPGDFFKFLKCGSQASAYDLSSLSAGASAYLELAYGRAWMTKKQKLTLGYRVKALVGVASIDVNAPTAALTVNANEISANVLANGRMACSALNFGKGADGKLKLGTDFGNVGPAGYGAAIDFGVKYKPIKSLTITAGISDLGAISWKYNSLAKASGSYSFEGFDNIGVDTDFDAEINNIKSELEKVFSFSPIEGTASAMQMLPFTLNAGVRYRLPIVRFISVGALATYHNDALAPYYDARFGATLTPLSWLSVTANTGKTSTGNVCGAALSVSLLFLNVFASVDAYSGPIGIYNIDGVSVPMFGGVPFPVDAFRYRANLGLTMQFGKRYKVR